MVYFESLKLALDISTVVSYAINTKPPKKYFGFKIENGSITIILDFKDKESMYCTATSMDEESFKKTLLAIETELKEKLCNISPHKEEETPDAGNPSK